MIRKIQGNEYLKRYDNMTAQERMEYEGRVGQWLSDNSHMLAQKGEVFEARMQNALQVSASWNDQECQAFEEGARLLSALVPTVDTWLPDMLYVKSAKRCIKQMVETLWELDGKGGEHVTEKKTEGAKEERAEGASKATHAVAPFQGNNGDGDIAGGDNKGEGENKEDVRSKKEEGRTQPSSITPARPKHIDQYIHLLPQKTQEHAALVQGLYRELDEARQKMQLLMDDKTASPADREAWAKKATKCDNTLRKIFDELDAEWAKLVEQGRVVVDDLGNARVVSSPQNDEVQNQEPAELTSEQKARRRELRKWLTDTRRGNGAGRDERVKQWKVNFKEYLTLKGDKAFEDEKILEAIKHYEIDSASLVNSEK